MMRSLNSAVAGLRTHQTKMDVIGNNIANVNTYGFKSSRVTFADIYYQTLTGASSPTNTRGGTNPTQIGYGSAVATIDVLTAQAGGVTTDRALDVYITGDGFLVTTNSRGDLMYTRLGNLGFDADGNLIDPNGNFVMGFPMTKDIDGNDIPDIPANGVANGDNIAPINVSPEILDKLTGISIGLNGEIVGILEGGGKVTLTAAAQSLSWLTGVNLPEDATISGSVKMTVGGVPSATLIQGFLTGQTISTPYGIELGDVALDPAQPMKVWSSGGDLYIQGVDASGATITAKGRYNSNGDIELKTDGGSTLFVIRTDKQESGEIPANGANSEATATPIPVANITHEVRVTGVDKGGNKRAVQQAYAAGTITLDGGPTFTLAAGATAFAGEVAKVGSEDPIRLQLGNLVLAKFRNAAGLEEIGNSQFMATNNSGDAQYVRPGQEGTGSTKSTMLELSNVDISKEFTDMITTQRGFQANTRIITVSDEMLQELVNLKR